MSKESNVMQNNDNAIPPEVADSAVNPLYYLYKEVFKQDDEQPIDPFIAVGRLTREAKNCLLIATPTFSFCSSEGQEEAITRPADDFIYKQIKNWLRINHPILPENKFDSLYNQALTSLATLFTPGDETPVARWNKFDNLIRTIIALRAGLLHFCTVADQTGQANSVNEASLLTPTLLPNRIISVNFDLIYLQFLIEYLASNFDLPRAKANLIGPLQIISAISQADGFPIPREFFRHLNIDFLNALQRRHLDLAALLDNYLHQGSYFFVDAEQTSIPQYRAHFLSRLTDAVKIQQIIDSLLYSSATDPSAIKYDTIAFVNANGKTFSYFTEKVILESQKQGFSFSPERLINALEKYFYLLGESTQFTIGSVAHSLHSICLRYQALWQQTPLASRLTLATLKQRMDENDQHWTKIKSRIMKPSLMVGLHLMHSRGVRFVDSDWGAQLWESTLKQEVKKILEQDQMYWSKCALPFADLSQNAADAFQAFSSFQPIDTERMECVRNIVIQGEGITRSAAKRQAINIINNKIQALRKTYLAQERLISKGNKEKNLAMALAYYQDSFEGVLASKRLINSRAVALRALKSIHPGRNITFFTEATQENTFDLAGKMHLTNKISRIDLFLINAQLPNSANEYPNARQQFNQVIDEFIHTHRRWIISQARENVRIKGEAFGDAEIQTAIHQVIYHLLELEIHQNYQYSITKIVVSFIPFIGASLQLFDGVSDRDLTEFLLGSFFLSLDSYLFIASPLRATMTAGELVTEATARTTGLQPMQTELKAVIHVVKQLNISDSTIENSIRSSQVNQDAFDIAKSSVMGFLPPENRQLVQKITTEAKTVKELDVLPRWRGNKVVRLEKENRIVPIVKDQANQYVEVSWHTAQPIHPRRIIYCDVDSGNFFSERSLGGIGDLENGQAYSAELLSDGNDFEVIDDIDREYNSLKMRSDPVVISSVKSMINVADLSVKEAQSLVKDFFNYRYTDLPVLVGEALRKSIDHSLNLAAERSPTFRRLLHIKKTAGSASILFDLSDNHLFPRAYPNLSLTENLINIAKEDVKNRAEHDAMLALKIANSGISDDEIKQVLASPEAITEINQAIQPDVITARLKVLQTKHRWLTIDMLPADKISELSYVSFDGAHPVTLLQCVFHEIIHVITGLKDISSQIISGLSPAARGIGAVDHLTDRILFEIGENIPIRVIYATQEIMRSSQIVELRELLIKRAFRQTEAQKRAIDYAFKHWEEQSIENTVLLGQPIQERSTIAQAMHLKQQKMGLLAHYNADITAKDADLWQLINGQVGLLKNLDLSTLPDHLYMAYQKNFNDLLTKNKMIANDALAWWNKNGLAKTPWKIRVERVENAIDANFEPISINKVDQVIEVRHHDQLVYLSERGIKPLETSRLAALTLQKLFNQPFEVSAIGSLRWDDRGWEVFRTNQILAQLSRGKLKPQISYFLVSNSDQTAKQRLLSINHSARLAAWKENAFLKRIFNPAP